MLSGIASASLQSSKSESFKQVMGNLLTHKSDSISTSESLQRLRLSDALFVVLLLAFSTSPILPSTIPNWRSKNLLVNAPLIDQNFANFVSILP
jgi:hypothetical protein